MRIRLLTAAGRPPHWALSAFSSYARRLPRALKFDAVQLPLARGHDNDPARAVADEGARMLALIGERDTVVALDEKGEAWDTRTLAARLHGWEIKGADVVLLVGGPDGLSTECLARADTRWSLSPLTLPHALVRVVVAEQLYRAWSINQGHPYHRP